MADRYWVEVVMTEESSELPRISRWGLAGFRAREHCRDPSSTGAEELVLNTNSILTRSTK